MTDWIFWSWVAPEPEVIEDLKDLIVSDAGEKRGIPMVMPSDVMNEKIREAYRRGQKAGNP